MCVGGGLLMVNVMVDIAEKKKMWFRVWLNRSGYWLLGMDDFGMVSCGTTSHLLFRILDRVSGWFQLQSI